MSSRLDRTRPYAQLLPPQGRACFLQDGRYFAHDGEATEASVPEKHYDVPEIDYSDLRPDYSDDREEGPVSLVPPDIYEAMLKVAEKAPYGRFVEVGVYNGGTAWHLSRLAKLQKRELHLFDTFEGMPGPTHPGDLHGAGDFTADLDTVMRALEAPHVFFYKGLFPHTLEKMPDDIPIAFCHCDCDQYESVAAVCREIPKRMLKGGIIWFDDYGQLPGATAAVDEAFAGRLRDAPGGRAYVVIGESKALAEDKPMPVMEAVVLPEFVPPEPKRGPGRPRKVTA